MFFNQGLLKGEDSADVILLNIHLISSSVRTLCELMCFKLGMMLNTYKFYSFIPV